MNMINLKTIRTVIFILQLSFLFQLNISHGQLYTDYSRVGTFYHPADSTIYFTASGLRWWEDDSLFLYVFRLKNEANQIERSTDLVPRGFFPGIRLTHDNIARRFYSNCEGHRIVTDDGGESWDTTGGPEGTGLGYPGDNPGEMFLKKRLGDPVEGPDALLSTTNSWESWDTSFVVENWNLHDYSVFFTRNKGHLIRYRRSTLEGLSFSSDTGRTWELGELANQQLHAGYTWIGAADEFYRGYQGMVFWCISDSGRDIREVFDFRDYGPYDYIDNGGFQWNWGYLVTTPYPGEFYAIIDSTSWDSWGIKMDIYHCWDYGERIEMLRYNMPMFEPSDPEWVASDVTPLPKTSLLSVFPNPTNGGVNVHLDRGIRSGSLSLYDLAGRLAGRIALKPTLGQTYFHLNLNSFLNVPESSGAYLIVINADGKTYSRTIAVVR